MDGAVHNKVVFERIAKKLQKQGYERDWKQSRSKKLKITMEKQEGEDMQILQRTLLRFYYVIIHIRRGLQKVCAVRTRDFNDVLRFR